MKQPRGFAVLTYLLVSVAVMGVLSAMLLLTSNRSSTTDQSWSTASQIVGQANLLRSKLLDCANNGAANGATNGTAYHPAYPKNATVGVWDAVRTTGINCPASGGGLLTGTDGVFLPPAPSGFNDWEYVNDGTTCSGYVCIRLRAANVVSAAAQLGSLSKASAKYGAEGTLQSVASTNDTFQLVITK